MKRWYVAVTIDGKDTILGTEHTLKNLGNALGLSEHAIGYYYRNNLVCKKLCAKIIQVKI